MTTSVNVSIEPSDEYHVQEITYDGQEKLIQPLTMSESLTKLTHKIDFSKPIESIEEIESDSLNNTEEDKHNEDNKELAISQTTWPWESVRSKLRNSLTEISVLLDVITISKNKHYLVLDPVSQKQAEYKPISFLFAKKTALHSAASIISSSAERLKNAHADLNRNKSTDFQTELKSLRQNWRLKKSKNKILGDLSYRNAGSRYSLSGVFEVTKTENTNSQNQTLLNVTIPSDLEGVCYVHVRIHKGGESLCEIELNIPAYKATNLNWQQKLEIAQNVLFCKELFSQLAREAVQLQLPIPALVIGNQILITLFPDIKLVIGLCHSQPRNKRAIEEEKNSFSITKDEHMHVLEHSLHQMLREIHYQALHHPMPHPATATLGISKKRYFAGPAATDKQTLIECEKQETMLEKIMAQAQHMVLRSQTMKLIDDLVLEIKDPLILAHWVCLNSPVQTSVRMNISSYGYENLCRTPFVIHLGIKSLIVINRDGRKFSLSYEPEELRHLILSQISHHQVVAVHSLTKMMGWKAINFTSNCGFTQNENLKTNQCSSMLLCSPNGERYISLKYSYETGPQVSISVENEIEKFEPSSIIKDKKWYDIKKKFKKVNLDKMEGKNFLSKMESLMALLTKIY